MFCSKCGNEIIDGSKFCSKCGNKIKQKPKIGIKNKKETNKSIKIFIIVLLSIIILTITISFFIVPMLNNKKSDLHYSDTDLQYNNTNLQYNTRYVYENMYITFFEDGTYTRNVEGITTANYTFNKETGEIICKEIQNLDEYEMDLEMIFKYLNENEIQRTSMKISGIVSNGFEFGEIYSTQNTLKEKQEDYNLDNNSPDNNLSNINDYSSNNNSSLYSNDTFNDNNLYLNDNNSLSSDNNNLYSNNNFDNSNSSSNNNDNNSYSNSNNNQYEEENKNSEKEQLQIALDSKKQSRQDYLEKSNEEIARWANDIIELRKQIEELKKNGNNTNDEDFDIQQLEFQIGNRQSIKEDLERAQKRKLDSYDKEIAILQEKLNALN